MSRRNEDKGRLPPFVPLDKEVMHSPAWRATSCGARILYNQIGLALGDRIANLSQRFEAGREIGFHEALRQAFPDGLPTRPDGTIDAAGIVNKIRARSLPCSPWRRGNRWPGWCRQMPAA
jgi:hypothetical protein